MINDGEFMVLLVIRFWENNDVEDDNQPDWTDWWKYLFNENESRNMTNENYARDRYVLSTIALFSNLTVAENIALIPGNERVAAEQITAKTKELLEKVGLPLTTMPNHQANSLVGNNK